MGDAAVRAATAADLDAVRAIYRRASLSNEGSRPLLEAHPDLLELDEHDFVEGRTMAAVEDDLVVGFATLSTGDGALELDALFVDPDHQRRGHASRLMEEATKAARRAGVDRIEVTANEGARAFYKAAGFAQTGMAETQHGPAPRMVRRL